MSDLPKPDLLHTMHIGMFDPLQKWIFHFMKRHERLHKYNAISLSVPAYHNLTPNNMSYEEVSQWNGKEMKEMRRYLLGVLTQLLRGRSPAQCTIFNDAIECKQAFLKFDMYARYISYDDATLSATEDALHRFHTFKDVFLLMQAGNNVTAKANALRTELLKKQKVDKETNADTWTPSKKRHETNTWRDYISHTIDVSKELDTDFNFPTIHMMYHWVKQIRQYRALQ